MGIQSQIQTALGTAFDSVLADAVTAFTLRSVNPSTYNTATGAVTETYTDYTSRGVEYSSRVRDFYVSFYSKAKSTEDDTVETDLSKLIVLQNELAVMPKLNDYVLIGAKTFRVESVGNDPADATYELVIRIIKSA